MMLPDNPIVNPNISITQQILNWDINIPDAVWDFLYNANAWTNVFFGDGVLQTFFITIFALWLTVVSFRAVVFLWKLLPFT